MELEQFPFAEQIAEAARGRFQIRMTYPEHGVGGATERMVEPYSYREKPNGTLFFGYDLGAGSIKGFRLDRIESVEVTQEPYEAERWTVEIA